MSPCALESFGEDRGVMFQLFIRCVFSIPGGILDRVTMWKAMIFRLK